MYVGPETVVPLTSALAAVAGFLLLFWRRVVAAVRSGLALLARAVSRLFASR